MVDVTTRLPLINELNLIKSDGDGYTYSVTHSKYLDMAKTYFKDYLTQLSPNEMTDNDRRLIIRFSTRLDTLISSDDWDRKLHIHEPQPLTDAFKRRCVKAVSNGLSAIPDNAKIMGDNFRDFLKSQLDDPSLKLTKYAEDYLVIMIEKYFEFARVDPGSAVGIWASEAIGRFLTQKTLNTFHYSGTGNNTILSDTRNLLTTKKRSSDKTYVYFNNDRKFETIFKIRNEMTEINMHKLTKDTIYQEFDTSNLDPNLDTNRYNPEEHGGLTLSNYLFIREHLGKDFREKCCRFRFILDKYVMYNARIMPMDLYKCFDDAYNNNSDGSRYIVVCPGTPAEGVLDIFPLQAALCPSISKDAKNIYGWKNYLSGTKLAPIFINVCLLPKLKDLIVKGIKGIKRAYPEKIRVPSVIIKETNKGEGVWDLKLDVKKMKNNGITYADVQNMTNLAGINITAATSDTIIVEANDKPSSILQRLVSAEEDLERTTEGDKYTKGDHKYIMKTTDNMSVLEKWFIITDGTNLPETLKIRSVNRMITYCNNPFIIYKTLGLGAAHMYLRDQLILSLEDSGIDPRHVNTIVTHMLNRGSYITIGGSNIVKHGAGTISAATTERAGENIKATAFGSSETTSSTTVSIAIGSMTSIGTGYAKVISDKAKLDELRKDYKLRAENKPVGKSIYDYAIRKILSAGPVLEEKDINGDIIDNENPYERSNVISSSTIGADGESISDEQYHALLYKKQSKQDNKLIGRIKLSMLGGQEERGYKAPPLPELKRWDKPSDSIFTPKKL